MKKLHKKINKELHKEIYKELYKESYKSNRELIEKNKELIERNEYFNGLIYEKNQQINELRTALFKRDLEEDGELFRLKGDLSQKYEDICRLREALCKKNIDEEKAEIKRKVVVSIGGVVLFVILLMFGLLYFGII